MIGQLPRTWIIPEWNAPANIRAIITTREGGASRGRYAEFNLGTHVGDVPDHVSRNRESLRKYLPDEPKWLRQNHGSTVVVAETVQSEQDADAAFTRCANVVCVVMTADCLPILLTDRDGSVVAAVHAGWRGLVRGIIKNTVVKLNCDSSKLLAYLGPAIGPQVYEVGSDVRNTVISADCKTESVFNKHSDGKWYFDLYELARQQLFSHGITQIFGGGICTFSDPGRFFSYRRDGAAGRMAALIWRTEN